MGAITRRKTNCARTSANFVAARNFAKRLKTLKGLTLRIHLQMLDKRVPTVHFKPAPSNPGTKQLGNDDAIIHNIDQAIAPWACPAY